MMSSKPACVSETCKLQFKSFSFSKTSTDSSIVHAQSRSVISAVLACIVNVGAYFNFAQPGKLPSMPSIVGQPNGKCLAQFIDTGSEFSIIQQCWATNLQSK